MIPVLPERARPLLFAHRGCSSLAPENTMASFNKARSVGAPGLELDVHGCLSHELVVAHDDTFRRTAGDDRAIADMLWDDIRHIDVGAGESPPLLESVLEEFCPEQYVDIELKTRRTRDDPLPGRVAALLVAMGERVLHAVTVSSFNPVALLNFKKICRYIPTAIIWSADHAVPPLLRYGFGGILSGCDYLKPVHTQVRRFFRPAVPWTVDDTDLAARLLKRGCVGIITNRPQDFHLTGKVLVDRPPPPPGTDSL
jgi:glycerophosphoryl diester phosphodiesterase